MRKEGEAGRVVREHVRCKRLNYQEGLLKLMSHSEHRQHATRCGNQRRAPSRRGRWRVRGRVDMFAGKHPAGSDVA